MTQTLIEKHEDVVIEMGAIYLDNMELELGRKYKNNNYQISPGLSDDQYMELKKKHGISVSEFAGIYTAFQNMKPTKHLKQAMDAFTQSGGNVDIEPRYDEETKRLTVPVSFSIKGNTFDKIEGLSAVEDIILKMNAMLQIDTVLSGADPDMAPEF